MVVWGSAFWTPFSQILRSKGKFQAVSGCLDFEASIILGSWRKRREALAGSGLEFPWGRPWSGRGRDARFGCFHTPRVGSKSRKGCENLDH